MDATVFGYSIVCGTAGVRLRRTAEAIRDHLEKRGKVSYQNGEDLADNTLASRVARPRGEALRIWNANLKSAVESLDPDADFRFITCHLTLFNRARNVTFAPALLDSFYAKQFEPDRVIVLIDDIFDVYGRLSSNEPDSLFAEDTAIQLTEERMINSVKRGAPEFRDLYEKERALNIGITRIAAIQQLVAWRRAEMQFAENLAAQGGLPLYLVAVKHPMVMVDLLLRSGGRPTVAYLSHPITNQRWEFLNSDNNEWPNYVTRINDLPRQLVEYDIATISPTTIDEARFQPPTTDYIHVRNGAMLPRWPLSKGRTINGSGTAAMHHEHAYDDEIFQHDPLVSSGYVKALQVLLSDEVPYRDHYIIVHTPNFIAYQTREGGGPQSLGVGYEIQHFEELAEQEAGERRMVSVHDVADVQAIVALPLDEGSLAARVASERAVSHVRKSLDKRGLNSTYAATELLRHGRVRDSALSAGVPEEDATLMRNEALEVYSLTYLYLELSGLQDIRDWCLVVIDNLSSQDQFEVVSKWLHSGRGAGDFWSTYGIPFYGIRGFLQELTLKAQELQIFRIATE